MHLRPFLPPGPAAFLIYSAVWFVVCYFLPRLIHDPLATFLLTVLSFIPFATSSAWLFWIIQVIGSSGYAGLQDPRIIMMRVVFSFLIGVAVSAVMLIMVGIRVFIVMKSFPIKK